MLSRLVTLFAGFALYSAAATALPAGKALGAECSGAAASDVVYLPNITKTLGGVDGWGTPFIVQNIGMIPADLEVSFYRFDDGSLVTCRRVVGLQAHASWADIPNNDHDLPDDTQFAVLVRAYGAQVSAVVNEHRGSLDAPVAMSYTGFASGSTSVSLPNITRRFYGYDTPFIVQNLGSQTAEVTASFVSFDATKRFSLPLTILPGRAKAVDPDFTAGLVDGTQYAVTLTSSQPIVAVVNEFNAFHPFGVPLADSYNGFSAADGATDLYIPLFIKIWQASQGCCPDNGAFSDSPLVVQNMDTKSVSPSLVLWNVALPPSMNPVTVTGPSLAPGASWVYDPLYQLGTTTPCDATPTSTLRPPPPTCLPTGSYRVHIHADGRVAARASLEQCCYLMKRTVSWPAQPLAQVVFLPNVVKTWDWSGGWNSFIYVTTNPDTTGGNAAFTASWYRFSDGQLVKTQTSGCLEPAPQGCAKPGFTGDPRDDPDLPDATQYSVVITADPSTPVAAIVYTYRTCGNCGDGMAYEGTRGH